jgi:hypothetical protein
MKRSRLVHVLPFGLLIAYLLAGCTARVPAGSPSSVALASDVTAVSTAETVPSATVTSVLRRTAVPADLAGVWSTTTAAIRPSVTLTLPATATAAVTALATPTPLAPSITLAQSSNLRAGPGTNYPVVGGTHAGDVLIILARDTAGDWWQVPGGWVFAGLGQANVPAARVPVATNIPPAPTAIRTPSPAPPATPTRQSAVISTALPAPAQVDTVILGQDTQYPVRAQRVIGWGYELVDASEQYDLVVHRDVYGVMAHKAWESLFSRHPRGIRITLIDPIRLDDCRRSWGSNPALAPIPLAHRNRGRCDDLVLPGGFGDGEGGGIAMGCAWDDPDSPVHVESDPEECFIAVLSPGPHLTDITVTASVVGYNWVKAGMSSQMTPDLAASPFSPLLGQAYREGDQWRWRDPYLEVAATPR